MAADDRAPRRTTVMISPDAQEIIDKMVLRFGGTASDAIRRALRLADQVAAYQEVGGRVVFENDGEREVLRFLF